MNTQKKVNIKSGCKYHKVVRILNLFNQKKDLITKDYNLIRTIRYIRYDVLCYIERKIDNVMELFNKKEVKDRYSKEKDNRRYVILKKR